VIRGYSQGRYEFFIVIIVIAIIAAIALGRYQQLTTVARDLGFEIISHHFMKGAADARVQWLLQPHTEIAQDKRKEPLVISGQSIYFSSQAWPASTQGYVNKNFQPTVDDCYGLWMALLQNPAPISKEGSKPFGSRQYHATTYGKACRYYQASGNKNSAYYFDYFPLEGRVLLSIPEQTNFQN